MAMHRPAQSVSSTSLALPPGAAPPTRQRRMTSPAGSLAPPPDGIQQPSARPPSPLRNGFTSSTYTGVDYHDISDDDDETGSWFQRSPSPASSVSQIAANFAQRVGSLVGNITPRSPGLPTEAELEAEAQRERDRSRREAERILSRESDQRQNVEDRVLAMLQDGRNSDLPPPPPRSQTIPNPPSPSGSQKERWWAAAKNRLTPTKEPLTPAQQVIQDAKAKEKKAAKSKSKDKDAEWPASSQNKYNDPAFLNLNTSLAPPLRPQTSSPGSPTPARPTASNLPPNLSPSPLRPTDSQLAHSPSREPPLLYAQFNPQGALDVHGTLLTVAKRFEKLEKWTVGHVRALEERMSDVERWLVDKEKEKHNEPSNSTSHHTISAEDSERIKEELSEMQSRVIQLGREMAKLVTSSSNLSSNDSLQSVQVHASPQTSSSFAVHTNSASVLDETTSPVTSPRRVPSSTAVDSTSPPIRSNSRVSSRTRLPYPTGDYAPSPDSNAALPEDILSPTNSPPSSITSATRLRPLSIPGLPGTKPGIGSMSPPSKYIAHSPPPIGKDTLPPPKGPVYRPSSVSPTPRKRYTVALGGPIVPPPEPYDEFPARRKRPESTVSTAYFSSSSAGDDDDDDDDGGESEGKSDFDFEDETIGKRASARFTQSAIRTSSPSPISRVRPQSAYGLSSLQTPQTPTTPLRVRARSRSSDRVGLGISSESGKFVDPLLLRRQEAANLNNKVPMRGPAGKIPVGQLVAFFDQDKRDRE